MQSLCVILQNLTKVITMNKEAKTQLQDKEFKALCNSRRVALMWATGTGKSNMAIRLVNNACKSLSKPRVLFLVAERAHIQNWKDEFEKWGLRKDIDLTMMCYNSLHKVEGEYFNILILDEAHHGFTEKRLLLLSSLQLDYVYLLSATLSKSKMAVAEEMWGKFATSKVSLKAATDNGILPEAKVFVMEMNLDDTIPNQRIQIGKGNNLPEVDWVDRNRYIYNKIPCIIKCTEKQKYIHITNDMEYWKQRYERTHNDFHKNRWVNLGSQRKRFLGDLKTKYVKDFLKKFPHKTRYICFCSSIAQTDVLNPQNTISSKRPTYLNQRIIDAFNKKQLNSLFAVGMANEGMNLKDIEIGIIIQLDGKERLFIQKYGRSLRAKDPIAYIFYYKGTQDENYLKLALENIEERFIHHQKLC